MSQFFASGGQSIGVSASASIPYNEYSGLISFRIYWLDLLAVQGPLKSLLQHDRYKLMVIAHGIFVEGLKLMMSNVKTEYLPSKSY